MDVQYTSFRFHPLVRIKLSFKVIFLSIAKVRIGNLNAPDKPISLQKQRVGLESTPQCHLKVDWVITFIHIFLIGEENEVQKIPLHSKEPPCKKPQNPKTPKPQQAQLIEYIDYLLLVVFMMFMSAIKFS